MGVCALLLDASTSLTLFRSNLNLPPGVSAPHGGAMQFVHCYL
jgi:hypothetical protein